MRALSPSIKSVEMITCPYDVIAVLGLENLHEIDDLVTQNILLDGNENLS